MKYLTSGGRRCCLHRRLMPLPGSFGASGWPLTVLGLVLVLAVATVSGIPTSVLANEKEANQAHHVPNRQESSAPVPAAVSSSVHQSAPSSSFLASEVAANEGQNQISVPKKRGVNPLLYNDRADYSGNSIPHGGVWDLDLDGPPSAGGYSSSSPFRGGGGGGAGVEPSRLRNYDLLASLLADPLATHQQPQTFYSDPVAVPSAAFGSYPSSYLFGADRAKRMVTAGNPSGRNHLRSSMRLKRSPSRMTPADALSLLALLESRDPYGLPPLDLAPADGPNDVLPSVYYQDHLRPDLDLPLSALALAQPMMTTYGDDDGEWMNTWAEPAVDYLGFPLDVDTLSRLDGYGSGVKPSKNGYLQQKRFLMTKRKRSVRPEDENSSDCHNNKDCLRLAKYGKPSAVKVSSA